ncbi:hypothetical protein [Kitasatospora sp. NPDC004289]
MLVQTELMPTSEPERMMVRFHTSVGSAVAVWRGDPFEVAGRHYIEWTVREEILWGLNTRPTPLTEPGIREDAGHVVLRGRLELVEEPLAVLDLGDSPVWFEIGSPPPPDGIDGTWVEITVAADKVELYPYRL